MKIYYNPENEGFYHSDFYKNIPASAIEISKQQYNDFCKAQYLGKRIDYDGENFHAVDRQLSLEDLTRIENSWVSSEITRAGEQLNLVQDSDPLAVGTVGSWRDYRKQLRVWQDNEKFPNKEFRPKAPDA